MKIVTKVHKINVEVSAVKNMLKANNISIEDLINDKDAAKYMSKSIGIDLSKIELKDTYTLLLDINKVLAIGEVENVPGMDGVRGFAVWFDSDAKNCWYLAEEDYDMVFKLFWE